MKKMRKITAFITAVLMTAVTVSGVSVSASVTEEQLQAYRESINLDTKELDDSGYYESILKEYVVNEGKGNEDRNFGGRTVVDYYEYTNLDNVYYVSVYLPEAKDELTLVFKEKGYEKNMKIAAQVTELLDGETEYSYWDQHVFILADRIGAEKYEEILEFCRPYIDDGVMETPRYTDGYVKTYSENVTLDRIYYKFYNVRNFPENRFRDVGEYLEENGIECRIVERYITDELVYYAVEPASETTIEEKYRIAAMIYNQFGYVMQQGESNSSYFEDYKEENVITADYTKPEKEIQSAQTPEFAENDDNILYGDLNSDRKVDITDMSLLSLHLIGDRIITEMNLVKAADVQYDNEVNLGDLAFFRQYLSKNIDAIGKFADLKDISGQCKSYQSGGNAKYMKTGTGIMITSVDEYMEYIGGNKYADEYLVKSGLNADEEFFKNNRLAVMTDYSESINGVKYELASVRTDSQGNIHLFYDRFYPDLRTGLAGMTFWITAVPGNPSDKTEVSVHFNDTHETTRISYGNRTVNTTDVIWSGEGEYPELSGAVTSMKQFSDEITSRGIDPAGAADRLGISEEFFNDYTLFYYTVCEPSTAGKNRLSEITLDCKNNLTMKISRYESTYGDEMLKYWFLAAAIPNNLLETALLDEMKTEVNKYASSWWHDDIESVYSDSSTEFIYDVNSGTRFIESLDEFDEINAACSGKYSHLRDELITENFFNYNILFVMDQMSEKTNIKYNLTQLEINGEGVLNAVVRKFINDGEPCEDADTEWHLAASIPRDSLMYDTADIIPEVTYIEQTAVYGTY